MDDVINDIEKNNEQDAIEQAKQTALLYLS